MADTKLARLLQDIYIAVCAWEGTEKKEHEKY